MSITWVLLAAFAGVNSAAADVVGEAPLSDFLSNDIMLGTAQNLTQTWDEVGPCIDTGGGRFCVYSRSSFNHGEGITIITTEETAVTLADLPIWDTTTADSHFTSAGHSDDRYHDDEIPGKGIGLVADRTIRRGELLMNRKPSFLADERIINDVHVVETLFPGAFANLPSAHQKAYLNLSTHIPVDTPTDQIRGVMLSNSFNIQLKDSSDKEQTFCATFLEGKLVIRPNTGL